MKKYSKGSSLIEILFALTIISIILSIAVLDTDTIYRMRLKAEALEFQRDIDSLRMDSLKRSTRSYLLIDIVNNNYKLKLKSRKGADHYISKSVYPKHFKINTIFYEYIFSRTGAVETGGTIDLKHKYGVWQITISPVTGKTKLKR